MRNVSEIVKEFIKVNEVYHKIAQELTLELREGLEREKDHSNIIGLDMMLSQRKEVL